MIKMNALEGIQKNKYLTEKYIKHNLFSKCVNQFITLGQMNYIPFLEKTLEIFIEQNETLFNELVEAKQQTCVAFVKNDIEKQFFIPDNIEIKMEPFKTPNKIPDMIDAIEKLHNKMMQGKSLNDES